MFDEKQRATKTIRVRYVQGRPSDHTPGDRWCPCAKCRQPRTVRVVTVS